MTDILMTPLYNRGRRGRDRIVWYGSTYPIGANHHKGCEFESRSWRGVLYIILCDKVGDSSEVLEYRK